MAVFIVNLSPGLRNWPVFMGA